MQEKTFEVAFAWISSDPWFVEKFRGRAWLQTDVLTACTCRVAYWTLGAVKRFNFIELDLEESAFGVQLGEYLGVRYCGDYFLYGSHSLRIMLTLDDLVQVTGGGYRSGFCRLDWNFHWSDQLGWLCCLDYVSFLLPFHGLEFVHGGVRFQFNCVGSRQCAGCLSEVWELMNRSPSGTWSPSAVEGVITDSSLEFNCSAEVVFPDPTFLWLLSTIWNIVVVKLLLCSKDNSATATGLIW